MTSIRAELEAAVTAAMKVRDRAALAVYRSALAAIHNAEAVPLDPSHRAGAIEAAIGLGSAEATRRDLTEADMIAVVSAEAAERRTAADSLRTSSPDAAQQLSRDADLLQPLVDRSTGPD